MSDSTHGPTEGPGESSIAPSIPQRASSKRSGVWDAKFASSSTDELRDMREKIRVELRVACYKLKRKRKVPMDDKLWDRYLHLARLHQLHAQAESQLGSREFNETCGDAESWYGEPDAQRFKLQYDSWSQWESIMKKHTKSLQERLTSGSESFVRLFTASKIEAWAGEEKLTDPTLPAMAKVYCPDPPAHRYRWDPVVQKWRPALRAVHLFPYRQSTSMDEIFGQGASKELFQPVNGLFLHRRIEKALKDGLLAIVPDIDLEPVDPQFPLNDQQERNDRVREWENRPIKDYKIIVIDKVNPEVTHKFFLAEDMGFEKIADLDGRKLIFKTGFRPQARYVWWTYLNTILRTAWNPRDRDSDVQHQEVRKVARYWGARGRYIKETQLLGFAKEIGHDVESLLNQGHDRDAEEPGLEACMRLH
ncbi:unnamed protein product [Clonostachys byssicola]|uniref:HNH nuclease domain-containing protein n=1 Tax=Clonostachys byssicola TaxID=160290 RepID=A0A9N9U8L3_9HYPO|nr:unnamed protein product [Clonostachys byssicola]